MTVDMTKINQALTQTLNEIYAKEVGLSRGFYIYHFGRVGEYEICYTKVRANYDGKKGFFSWIQRTYKNGKTRRMRIAKSGSGKKAFARAERLYDQLKEKENK